MSEHEKKNKTEMTTYRNIHALTYMYKHIKTRNIIY